MTKSIKEKERLKRIKKHEDDGTQLTPDLLKLKFCYETKDANSIIKPYFMHEIFNDFLKENMAKLILDIAKSIKQYEIKVKLNVATFHNYKSIKESYFKGVRIDIKLLNFKNEYLGKLICTQENIFSWESDLEIKSKDDINFIMLNIIKNITPKTELTLALTPNSKCKIPLIKKTFKQYMKDLKLNKNIKKDIGLIDSCISSNIINLIIYINQKTLPFFWYTRHINRNNNIYFSDHKIHLNSLEEYNDMTYFKNVINTMCPKLDIPDDYYLLENISEIKRLAKLINY